MEERWTDWPSYPVPSRGFSLVSKISSGIKQSKIISGLEFSFALMISGVLAGGAGGHGPPSEDFLGGANFLGGVKRGAKIDQKR